MQKIYKFTKMQGLGNDFVVLDGIHQSLSDFTSEHYRWLANRHFGIGCDQILLVERPTVPEADFQYRIFNADGGEVEQCGNGARCFARFVHEQGFTDKKALCVQTVRGLIYPRLNEDGLVSVNMGIPRFQPNEIPFLAETEQKTYFLEDSGLSAEVSVVSMGNPHVVQVVSALDTHPVEAEGAWLESHPRFPERVNVGFMYIENNHAIRLRVYERGAGETLACGTGACAAVVSGIRLGQLNTYATVEMQGGKLTIEWAGEGHPVWMTGPAITVFQGTVSFPSSLVCPS